MSPAPVPQPSIHPAPLPYERKLASRALAEVTLAVIHCTELPDLATARQYGEQVRYDSGTGNSGHYYIDRDGRIEQYVALDRIAHHVRGRNAHSIGIELVNTGRYPHWLDSRHQAMHEPYPQAQVEALLALLAWLPRVLPSLRDIAGHEDLDTAEEAASDDPSLRVPRKRDPGPLFPWERVMAAIPLRRIGARRS
ncbi:N-acetylmuramoyl-L-alanine amidase [[Pseudomonas] boreopolis]|uniref:N-acetylmuramoyl-L-alanine amidase n=1 Tax=Xanthomonas boreopolis TaxID=86183 RepID=UPI003DA11A45